MARGDRHTKRSSDRQVVGSPGSFESFYRHEVGGVLALAIGLTKRHSEAEEVTQEAFFRAYRDWAAVGLMEYPGAWVRRVALNLAVGRWRRVQSEARAALRLGSREEEQPSNTERDEFWDAVRSLPRRQAQVVALTYVDDLSVKSIADVLGIARSTVRVHLARARATLATRFEAER